MPRNAIRRRVREPPGKRCRLQVTAVEVDATGGRRETDAAEAAAGVVAEAVAVVAGATTVVSGGGDRGDNDRRVSGSASSTVPAVTSASCRGQVPTMKPCRPQDGPPSRPDVPCVWQEGPWRGGLCQH